MSKIDWLKGVGRMNKRELKQHSLVDLNVVSIRVASHYGGLYEIFDCCAIPKESSLPLRFFRK